MRSASNGTTLAVARSSCKSAMASLEEVLAQLSLLRQEMGIRQVLIVKTWDESVRQFEQAVGRVSPDLNRTHLPWVVALRQESVDEYERVIKQLEELEIICQKLSLKPAAEQQTVIGAVEATFGRIYQNAEQIGRRCLERNRRLREFSKKLT